MTARVHAISGWSAVCEGVRAIPLISVMFQTAAGEQPKPESPEQTAAVIPASFFQVYQTGFEDVRKKDPHQLEWDFPHWFEYAAMHAEDGGKGKGEGGARMWVETNRARSGQQSIGLELFDIERSRRSEFVLFPDGRLGSEYWVSYWLCLPEDSGLFEPTIDLDWYEIGQLYCSAGGPYAAIHISNPDAKQEYFDVTLCGRHQDHSAFTAGSKRMKLPKGKWFRILTYVKRDRANGAIKLWFDGHLIGEKAGFPTMNTCTEKFTISVAKVYHERGVKVRHKLWVDDLTLYSKAEDSEHRAEGAAPSRTPQP